MRVTAPMADRPLASALTVRVRAHVGLKLLMGLALTVAFCVPYFWLQRWQLYPAMTLPLTPVDTAIPFTPRWTLVYQSVYLLLALPPALAATRADLRRYAAGFLWMIAVALTCFLLFPVACPRPSAGVASGAYRVLVSYDGTVNCIPSLHAAFALFGVLYADRVLAFRGRARAAVLALGGQWVAAILYATLATKQHYAVDLPPGLLLAYVCHRAVWRGRGVRAPARALPIRGAAYEPQDRVAPVLHRRGREQPVPAGSHRR
jgi:hypothetical protein